MHFQYKKHTSFSQGEETSGRWLITFPFQAKTTAVLHSVSFCAETWPQGVHEGPLFIYPHVGGWCKRATTAVFNAWSWHGKDPARDRQILRERCQGSMSLTRGIRFLQEHFHEQMPTHPCSSNNELNIHNLYYLIWFLSLSYNFRSILIFYPIWKDWPVPSTLF